MEESIKIIFWGVRGSTPCPNSENMEFGGNTTCVQMVVPGNNELLIFDCGTGFRNLGNALENRTEPHNGRIFITHPHWDHLQGFPFFKPFYDQNNWFRIYLPPQGKMGCREILQGHMSKTFFPVSMDMLQADLDCESVQPGKKIFKHYSVESMWAHHTVPTAIFKLQAHGKTIVFAPDNEILERTTEEGEEFSKRLASFLEGADLLIHDAQYTLQEYAEKKGWGHTAWEYAVEAASEAGIRHLYLTHHDPDNSDSVLSAMEENIKERHAHQFETIGLAKEGQEVILPCVVSDNADS